VTPGTCPGYTSPFEPYHSALTARISKVSPSGHRTTVAGGLPSARDRFGDVLGAADVVVHGRTVYALVAGGGCSRGPEDTPSGIWRLDRDITPTAMTRRGGHLYVGNLGSFPIQRGASIIFRVDRHGRHQRVVATGLSFPTGIAAGPDGDLYVSEHGYGGDPTAGRILRVRLR
jgi:hypothetical protein